MNPIEITIIYFPPIFYTNIAPTVELVHSMTALDTYTGLHRLVTYQ